MARSQIHFVIIPLLETLVCAICPLGYVRLHISKTYMAYQKTLAIRDYLAFTFRSAITECIHKTIAIYRKTA